MQNTAKSRARSGQGERTDSMIAASATKLATADLNNLMQALEIDVIALTEMLIPSGYRAEMGTIDAPAIHYTISGRGRISIGNGPSMPLEPHLLIIKPPNTPFAIEVDGASGPMRLMSRDCWKRHDDVLRIGMPTEQPEVIQICGFFNASFGQSVGLFRELREPLVEKFEPTDKIDLKLREAVVELCSQEIGMGAMTASLLKQVIIALVRRSMKSLVASWRRM